MDGLIYRLYRRLGRYYLFMLFCVSAVWAASLCFIVVYVAVHQYLGLPNHVMWHVLRVLFAGVAPVMLIVFAVISVKSRAGVRWMAGTRDASNAAAAWDSNIRLPTRTLRIAPAVIFVGCIPAGVVVASVAHVRWFMIAAIFIGVVFSVLLGVVVTAAVMEVLLMPITEEIDASMPPAMVAVRNFRPSIRSRLIWPVLLLAFATAWLTSGVTSGVQDPGLRLVFTIGAAATVALSLGLVVMLAFSRSLLERTQRLVQATVRVREGDLQARVPIVSDDELGLLARSFNDMVAGLAEREALRSALGTYIDPVIAERLLAEGEFLTGEDAFVTIMFVDIVGFSTRAEMKPAEQVCDELNEFFGIVLPVVAEHSGHTNKLIGDGLLAVFGTPVKLDDHADRALDAACVIQDRLTERYRGSLRAGVGLHTGTVTVGTMGAGSKLDFTLIGDAVNVASRVEALTRTTGDDILITETTRDALRRPTAAFSARGVYEIRGRAEPVSLFAVVSRIPA